MPAHRLPGLLISSAALFLIAGCENMPQMPSFSGGKAASTDPALVSGFLCCNVRTDGSWVSDSNYRENAKKVIPVGTPVKITSFGRYRFGMDVEGYEKTQYLGNDYSRSIGDKALAKRYVVQEDPRTKLSGYPANIQAAINASQLLVGMSQEQVVMAIGWPIADENTNLDARIWRYWLTSFEEYQIEFDKNRVVTDVVADRLVKNQIMYKP